MPWQISADVETALWAATKRILPASVCTGAALTQAVIECSRRYTSNRAQLDAAVPARARGADLAARALFFAPADAAKVMVPLAEIDRRGLLPDSDPLRILDVGAGSGTMTLGALDFLRRIGRQGPVLVHALDRDDQALAICRTACNDVAARWRMNVAVTSAHGDLPGQLPRQNAVATGFDLILVGNLLNELAPAACQSLVSDLLAALSPRGALIIVEPALRDTARALHRLRDWILDAQQAHVFAPCIRQQAPCPALEDQRDWCHEDRPVILPERTAKMAFVTGLRNHGLKFAYLVLRRDAEPQLPGDAQGNAVRVVSQLRKLKGKRECFVCSDSGRLVMRLLKRNRSSTNRGFDRTRRGDVLIATRSGGDLDPDDTVEVVRIAEGALQP